MLWENNISGQDEKNLSVRRKIPQAHHYKISGENIKMASNKSLVPDAKDALDKFKMEAAGEVGVNLKQGYNGDLTSKQAGSVGGQMVKKMIESYENSIKTK